MFDGMMDVKGKNILAIFLLAVLFFIATSMSLTSSDKTFEIFKIKDDKNIYYIDIPIRSNFCIGIKGYHGGITYEISYGDSAEIYFSSDSHAVTVNWKNIEIQENQLPNWWNKNDTIVSGKQTNGSYWKEIFKGGIWRGYLNVSSEKKNLFDSSLNTFRKTKQLKNK